jgi:formate dehydrogenase maturation protein FdhE
MFGSSVQSLMYVGLAASAAVLMTLSGLQKKVLRRKETRRRCPTCGRTDRYACACRR